MAGKHRGEWPRCQTCGRAENEHNVRHPFKPWRQAKGNPDRGPRCGECRMGLGVHNVEDPLCELPESAAHRAWLAGVDELVAQGVDPFLAIVRADPRSG